MIVKNSERIARMIISLEAILETDKTLDEFDQDHISSAIDYLKQVAEGQTLELNEVYGQPE